METISTRRLEIRMTSIFDAIENSIDNMGLFPALILIYSSIDFLGSLRNPTGYSKGEFFNSWAKEYILTGGNLPCTEDELWQARCGIIHTQRYDSKHASQSARRIVYTIRFWDDELKKKNNSPEYIVIHVDDLFTALKAGFEIYYKEIISSPIPTIHVNLEKLPDYIDLIPITIRCPKCESDNVENINTASKIDSALNFDGVAEEKVMKRYQCIKCGYEW